MLLLSLGVFYTQLRRYVFKKNIYISCLVHIFLFLRLETPSDSPLKDDRLECLHDGEASTWSLVELVRPTSHRSRRARRDRWLVASRYSCTSSGAIGLFKDYLSKEALVFYITLVKLVGIGFVSNLTACNDAVQHSLLS